MPLMLMLIRVVFAWKTDSAMLRRMLLLIWVGVTSVSWSWMLWRGLLKVRARWCPIMQQLHRSMIAVSRVAVNHDGNGVLP